MSAVNGNPYPTLKRPATLDHLKAKPHPWKIVDICDDPEALRALATAEKALLDASMAIPSDVLADEREARLATYRADVEQAKEAVEASTMQLLLGGIGRVHKRALLDEHPPRDEDHERVTEQGGVLGVKLDKAEFNGDTYPPALIAASLIEPKLTAEQVAELTADWNDNEFMLVWFTALEVNADSAMVNPKAGNGTRG